MIINIWNSCIYLANDLYHVLHCTWMKIPHYTIIDLQRSSASYKLLTTKNNSVTVSVIPVMMQNKSGQDNEIKVLTKYKCVTAFCHGNGVNIAELYYSVISCCQPACIFCYIHFSQFYCNHLLIKFSLFLYEIFCHEVSYFLQCLPSAKVIKDSERFFVEILIVQ